MVLRIDEVAQEIVDEFLRQGARLHISVHIDFRNIEAVVFQHTLNGNNVRVAFTPRERLHRYVDDVCSVFANFENAGHYESGAVVSVILYNDFRMIFLDHPAEFSEQGGLSYAGHIFQTDFRRARCDEFVCNSAIIFRRMNR